MKAKIIITLKTIPFGMPKKIIVSIKESQALEKMLFRD
jgi:hypothetical protein